ncbi:hypothetical protein [Helicobacter sp. MIT 01-3238]|uniref:hypothetical protein n=1 Tax=Helicobacter sp. MIT 01-3238 TaxID=398627 RepID=UPI0011C05447|nr:hypothetical protein [Helicobacter sp. MIT 01-3238]
MRFRTCKNFWEQQTPSLVLSQKFLQIQKPHRHYFDCCFELSLSQITRIVICVANRLQIKYESLFRHCEILRSKIVAIQNSPSLAEVARGWVIRHCEGKSTNRRNQSIPFSSLRGDLSPKQSTQKKNGLPRLAYTSLAMTNKSKFQHKGA